MELSFINSVSLVVVERSRVPRDGNISVTKLEIVLLGEVDNVKILVLHGLNLLPQLFILLGERLPIACLRVLCPFQGMHFDVFFLSAAKN